MWHLKIVSFGLTEQWYVRVINERYNPEGLIQKRSKRSRGFFEKSWRINTAFVLDDTHTINTSSMH